MVDAASGQALPEIVYLMGTGRSGTTILEILLANNPGICGVGEVTHVFKDGFIRNVVCSCGVPARVCKVWSELRRQCGWTDEYDARRDALFRAYSWHGRFAILALELDSRTARAEFGDVNHCLFSKASSLCGAEVVIDSSKYAGRALTLARLFPDKVRVISVTRSPAGLIRAFRKDDAGEQRPKSLLATCLYYVYVLACVRIASWQLGERVLHLRYDDLARDPLQALERIGRFLGRDLSTSMKMVSDNEGLAIGHIVTGNRIRLDGTIVFQPTARVERLGKRHERLVACLMDLCRRALHL